MNCFKCNKEIENKEVSLGMNFGVGAMYWCFDCVPPPKTAQEALETIDSFINPPCSS